VGFRVWQVDLNDFPVRIVNKYMRTGRLLSLLVTGLLITLAGAFGQSPPAFDVASVKPSPAWQPGMNNGMTQDPGRFTTAFITLRSLMVGAYNVTPWRVSGGPAWLDADGFDIVATYPVNTPTDRVELMLQTLLADRFQLKVHREQRDAPVYVMVIAKEGPKLKASPTDAQFSAKSGKGHLELRHAGMATLSRFLANVADRPVVDATEMKGLFDITLDWTPDTNQPGAADSGPSIFTAVQEQLGLRLEPRKSPFEFIVIDHVERPSEN